MTKDTHTAGQRKPMADTDLKALVERYERHGRDLFQTATALGWKDDGESPLNFIARHEREQGRLAATPSMGDEACVLCGKETNSYAGNPNYWPMIFPKPDGTGISHVHCTECVIRRVYARPQPADPTPASDKQNGRVVVVKNIAEMEAILNSEQTTVPLHVNPDGTVTRIEATPASGDVREALRNLMDCANAICGASKDDPDALEAFEMFFKAKARARKALKRGDPASPQQPADGVIEALEQFRDNGISQHLPQPRGENPFSSLADLEAYYCSVIKAIDAHVRNVAATALTAQKQSDQ
jgi:hypothetical protein